MKITFLTGILLSVALAAHAAPPAVVAPQIAFEQNAVTVSGLTRGGKLAVMIISRSPIMYGTETIDISRIVAVDETGSARVEFGQAVPDSTIVAAVDMESGVYALSVPARYRLRRLDLPANALRKKDDLFEELGLNQGRINTLLVRPNKGAWHIATNDGSLRDSDKQPNGSVSVNAAAMEPLDRSSGDLKKFLHKDVMVIVDPNTMTVMATEVPE